MIDLGVLRNGKSIEWTLALKSRRPLHDITNFINPFVKFKLRNNEPQKIFSASVLLCRLNRTEEGQAITSTGCACIYFVLPLKPRYVLILNSRTLSLDLPPLDNELLPLLDFSSPSLSSQASIVERFDAISEHLFRCSYLVCCSTKADGSPKRVLYELLEFEFYLIKVDCHSDPFTHDGEDQRLSGAWSVPILCMMSDKPNKHLDFLGTFIAYHGTTARPPQVLPVTAVALGKDST